MRYINVETTKEFEAQREEYIRSGYTMSYNGPSVVRLTTRYYGSILLHLVMLFMSFGILNVIYLIYRLLRGGDDVEIRIES
jgi:hypothetical protein